VSWHCEIRDNRQAIISPNVRLDAPNVDRPRLPSRENGWQIHEEPRPKRAPLRQIDGEAFEIGERAIGQRRLVCGPQDHARRVGGFEGFLPALRA
jgi:hypothetical protein